jgi:HD-like signal output (HDOD) protein
MTGVKGSLAERNPTKIAMETLQKLPPFSPVLNRLLAALAQEDVSFAKTADLIEKDTVLAGNVLGLVNSALYGRRNRANSVRHAVSLLGVNKLRNAALSMSIVRMWSRVGTPQQWSMARFNQYSIATAMLADSFSQHARVSYPEGAFTAGLFHDIGRLLIAVGMPKEYQEILRLFQSGDAPLPDCERDVLGITHAELSCLALRAWNLPEPIPTAVLYHHRPEEDPDSLKPGLLPLSLIVNIAGIYANQIGISIDPHVRGIEPVANAPLERLHIDEQLPRLLEAFTAEFEDVKRFF